MLVYESLAILYRDEHLLVLDKPTGLLAVPGRGPDKQDCLTTRVQREFPTALVVHRLDRDTSGAMVMALGPEAQSELNRQFRERQVEKWYQAIVAGAGEVESGVIDLPMRKDFDRPPRHCIDHEFGRPAVTHWRLVERVGELARIELQPITGRSHQLRLHLAHIGMPICGDPLYAPDAVRAMAARLQLHAWRIGFAHPKTAERMEFAAPCPF